MASPGLDGLVSLREALLATNAAGAGVDIIGFGIPITDANRFYYTNDGIPGSLTTTGTPTVPDSALTFDPDYPAGLARSFYRIRPTAALPLPTATGGVHINGTSQPGALAGAPVIEIDGSTAAGGSHGLRITIAASTVRGLVINGFPGDGIRLSGAGSMTVTGNYIGTDASGTKPDANGGNGITFLQLSGTPSTVGGATTTLRNIISSNGGSGVLMDGGTAPGITGQVRVQGNFIGTDPTGALGLGNVENGISVEHTGGHLIGGSGANEGNVVTGNGEDAIDINGNRTGGVGAAADNIVIQGNFVRGNTGRGIYIYATNNALSQASNNVIRGNVVGSSANAEEGVRIDGNVDNTLIRTTSSARTRARPSTTATRAMASRSGASRVSCRRATPSATTSSASTTSMACASRAPRR